MYIDYSKYDADGRIVEIGRCPESDLESQAVPNGGGLIKGIFSNEEFYVKDSVAIKFTEDQLAFKASISEKDKPFFKWNSSISKFIDIRPLEVLIDMKINDLKYNRDKDVNSGISLNINGKSILFKLDADTVSRLTLYSNQNINEVQWKETGGGWILLSLDDIRYILSESAKFIQSKFNKYKNLEEAALSAKTVEELQTINWKD